MLLLLSACAMLVPTAAAVTKLAALAVMGLSALRFAVTGVAQVTGSDGWMTLAGWIGLILGAVAFYAALGFELEDSRHRAMLPVFRRGAGADVMTGAIDDELEDVVHEAGVRKQL